MSLEPFNEVYRHLNDASDALANAQEVTDFQAIGVRCREALLAFTGVAQFILPWSRDGSSKPKQADFKGWVDHICDVTLGGQTHEYRRHLFKSLLNEAWRFSNWLTHAKTSAWYDAEAAASTVQHAVGLATSLVIRQMRGVPENCPSCGSHELSPQRGVNEAIPDLEWERPTCDKCGWTGTPVPIVANPQAYASQGGHEGDCIIPTVPLRTIIKPSAKED